MTAALAATVTTAWGQGEKLPDGRRLAEDVQRRIRAMPTLLRHDDFTDPTAAGLTFVPEDGKGGLEFTDGRWRGQKAVSLDRGWLQADPVNIPEEGFTVACWFRENGPGSFRPEKGHGGVVGVGSGWWDGWRLVVNDQTGAVGFMIGRPEIGGIEVACRSCIQRERWHHVAAVWDRETLRLYIDGELRAETLYDGAYTAPARQAPFLRIGELGYGIGTLKLDIADLALFSVALSTETIKIFAYPLAAQNEAVRACLLLGDAESKSSRGRFWRGRKTREMRAQAEYERVLALDASENPTALGNYQAIARLRIADSLRRAGHLGKALTHCTKLADDETVPLHYRAQAMQSRGDLYRDARRYREAQAAYTAMKEFFTGRHENFRVEALHRLADVDGLEDGEPFLNARQRRILRISQPAQDLFVAPDGDDRNLGTKARPFATLERARDAVRELKASGPLPVGGVAVYLRGGSYQRRATFELGEADSGTFDAPVVYRSYPGETAVLSGGAEVRGFRPATELDAPGRLPGEARAHVVVLDLKATGVSDFGSLQPRGFAIKPVAAHLELFFKGRPMQLARWPNPVGEIAKDFTQVKKLVGEDVRDFYSVPMDMGLAFVYGDERQKRWAAEPDAWVAGYWHRWFDLRVLPITQAEPEKSIFRLGGPKDNYRGIIKGAPYFGINLLCELDTPGEWYLDRDSGLLYFWPPSPLDRGTVEVSLLDEPLLALAGASHIVFRGLTLQAGRGDAAVISGGEGVVLAGCVIRNMGNSAVMVGGVTRGSVPVRDLSGGGRGHQVVGCDIHDLGDGGVSLCGGDLPTLTGSGHVVENCHIHDINRWNRAGYQPAITLDGVGCRASHNLIHDIPHQVVRVRRNDHIFEYNEVHDAPYEAREMGAYYLYGRDRVLGERGNVARYNMFHHIPYTNALGKSFNNAGRVIFHIDHMNGAMTVYGNIIWSHEGQCVFTSGGRDNMVENNIFYDCVRAVGLGDRSFVWTARKEKQRDRFLKYLRDLNVTQPPWSVRYPQLPGLLEHENPGLPENNVVARNIGARVVQLVSVAPAQRNYTVKDNWEGTDPGFRDAERGDFALGIEDPVVGEAGFDPIPVEQIGLYNDELRASWPVHHEVDTHEHMSIQRKSPADMPVCVARPRGGEITIDGRLDPAEWGGLDTSRAVVLGRSPSGGEAVAERSHVWILRDERYLYIAARNPVNPDKPLVTDENCWWRGDMMEIIIEGQIGVNTQGWWVDESDHGPIFWLLGDCKGDVRSIRQHGLPGAPAGNLGRKVSYAVRQEAGCWTAEWRIPFDAVCLDPVSSRVCCFNMQVNKTGTPIDPSWPKKKKALASWLSWVPGGGEVWNTGRLKLK